MSEPPNTIAVAGERRPIAARKSAWAARVAAWLARRGARPNHISLASIACAALAAGALLASRFVHPAIWQCALFLIAIVGIQARLLCNQFDGMVAIEGGQKGRAGEFFNDFPDRIADPLIFAAAGYAIGSEWGIALGWLAGVLALMTAYLRVLGQSMGVGSCFLGPMAKQHRMAVMSIACAVSGVACFWRGAATILLIALAIVCAGCIVTLARRMRWIIAGRERRT